MTQLKPQSSRNLGLLENIISLAIETNKKGAITKNLKSYLDDIRMQTEEAKRSGVFVLNIEPTENILTWKIGTQFYPTPSQ